MATPAPAATARLLALLLLWALACASAAAQTAGQAAGQNPAPGGQARDFLVGGSGGLYRAMVLRGDATAALLWGGAPVRSMVYSPAGWYFLGAKGIFFSADLRSFENRSGGLPVRTLEVFEGGEFRLRSEPAEIKSLAVDPAAPSRLAACTDSEIWYSENSGRTWRSLGSPTESPGMKCVSFGPAQGAGRHAVWASHAMKGLFAKDPAGKNGWTALSSGLPRLSGGNPEEMSSFALIPSKAPGVDSPLGAAWNFVAGASFLGRMYRWEPEKGTFAEIYSDGADFGTAESLGAEGKNEGYVLVGGMAQRFFLPAGAGKIALRPDAWLTGAAKAVKQALKTGFGDEAECLALPPAGASPLPAILGELWLIPDDEEEGDGQQSATAGGGTAPSGGTLPRAAVSPAESRARLADGKLGLYLQTGFVADPESRAKYFGLMKTLGLDSVVVDMKDDSGRLRFSPRSPSLAGMENARDALDIETFAAEAKSRGIYTIARIVVFKDEALYNRDGGSLAVRDSSTGLPWRGTKADGLPNQEFWVDPYSTDVWRYNVEIAREVTSRGFDEVQFDYIRFPTDGRNLGQASFPHRRGDMSQDSALESFLRYARQSLDVPLSIDIYGSNGWYRSGAGTGQDVGMISNYVDAICPMLYPSHFAQGFEAQAPAELRPYRIYKLGTLRNRAIARGKALIRPWVQAFFLNVSYDQTYYGTRYVENEVRGAREGADQGMIFWNNAGRYDDVPRMR